ncbi:MAG: O-antigen ligase family protein [Balneolaceae bacterium]
MIALGYFIFLNSQKIELDEIRVIFKGYFLGSIAISIYYFVINTQPITSHVTLPVGISGTINYTSFYLYIGYIIYPILFVRNRAQRILIFAIGIATVYLFKTRSVLFISLFSIVAPYVQFTIRRFITGTFGIGLAIYIVLRLNILNPDDPNDIFYSLVNWNRNFSNMERLYLIITGIEHAKDSIIGYGFGGIEKLLAQDTLIRGKHPHFHNTLLNMILSFGWIGTALYYLIFVSTFLKLLFSPKSLSPLFFKVFITFLAAVFIYSMIESILFNASLFFLIIIPIGVINSLVLNKKK